MTLLDIADWMKEFVPDEVETYVGKIEIKPNKVIGIYQREKSGEPRRCIGGKGSYDIKPISILIHWNNDYDETERQAQKLYDKLRELTQTKIKDTYIPYVRMMVPEPIDVDTDDRGTYERVIWIDLYVER